MDRSNRPALADKSLQAEVDALSSDALEFFNERAAIRQFEGKQSQVEAERAALAETKKRFEPRDAAGRPHQGP